MTRIISDSCYTGLNITYKTGLKSSPKQTTSLQKIGIKAYFIKHEKHLINPPETITRAGDMAQSITTLAEDLGSVLNTHRAADNSL